MEGPIQFLMVAEKGSTSKLHLPTTSWIGIRKEQQKLNSTARSTEDKFDFDIDIFSNGSSTIFVNMQNRQSINFQGEVDMTEKEMEK